MDFLHSLVLRCLLYLGGITTVLSSSSVFAAVRPVLTVYTYDSFQSKWGPGPKLKEAFLKMCECDLKFVNAADAGALLGRLRLEGLKTKADVVVGLDSSTTAEAKALGIFAPIKSPADLTLPVPIEDGDLFTPIDYGWFSFIVDTSAKDKAPLVTSLEQFISDPAYKGRVLIQDPRSSSVGLGLLMWMHARFADDAPAALKRLSQQVMAVGQGWSDTYSKFTKGESLSVLSYTTSEGYHRDVDKTERYKALVFDDGNYVQVEVAGKVKTTKNAALADSFLSFLVSAEAQKIIARGNWMYPVIDLKEGLPTSYQKIPKAKKSLYLPASQVQSKRKAWTEEWIRLLNAEKK